MLHALVFFRTMFCVHGKLWPDTKAISSNVTRYRQEVCYNSKGNWVEKGVFNQRTYVTYLSSIGVKASFLGASCHTSHTIAAWG